MLHSKSKRSACNRWQLILILNGAVIYRAQDIVSNPNHEANSHDTFVLPYEDDPVVLFVHSQEVKGLFFSAIEETIDASEYCGLMPLEEKPPLLSSMTFEKMPDFGKSLGQPLTPIKVIKTKFVQENIVQESQWVDQGEIEEKVILLPPNAHDDKDPVLAKAFEDGSPILIDVLGNDEGNNISIFGFDKTSAAGAVITFVNGQLQYDPGKLFQFLKEGELTTDTFSYTIKDENGLTSSAIVTVTIEGKNDSPEANNDKANVFEDGPPVLVNVLANDTDPDQGDDKAILSFDHTSTAGAIITLVNDQLKYNPGALFQYLGNGQITTDTFTYVMVDGNGETSSATVTMTIYGKNDCPVAKDDKGKAYEDGPPVLVNVLANDIDVDQGDSKTISSFDYLSAAGAVVSLVNDQLQYDPGALFQYLGKGQTTTDTFTYTMVDGSGATSSATVTMTIYGKNDCPVAKNDVGKAYEDGSPVLINVLANDTDVDQGDTKSILTFDHMSDAGAVVTLVNGQLQYDPGDLFQYLGAGQTTTDTFTYTMVDGSGATSSATVTMTIYGRNDCPTIDYQIKPCAVEKCSQDPLFGNILIDGHASDPDDDSLMIQSVNGIQDNGEGDVDSTVGYIMVVKGSDSLLVNTTTGHYIFTQNCESSCSCSCDSYKHDMDETLKYTIQITDGNQDNSCCIVSTKLVITLVDDYDDVIDHGHGSWNYHEYSDSDDLEFSTDDEFDYHDSDPHEGNTTEHPHHTEYNFIDELQFQTQSCDRV